jgi:F-type H+-transporting ATPase subunit a
MHEHELWLTALFNDHLAGVGNLFLGLVGQPSQARPWANYITMELLAFFAIIILFAILRGQLSADKPGKLQHLFEVIHEFISDQTHQQISHGYKRYVPFFGGTFLFILFCNLVGLIPTLESPTMFGPVTAGLAIIAFIYYNMHGVREQGLVKYLAHFAGPVWWLAPLMIPIEIISHIARPMSLAIRLYANMYAGEQVTLVFLSMTYLFVPAIFMGLHFAVSFLQAYVFTLLTMIYVGGAVAHEDH